MVTESKFFSLPFFLHYIFEGAQGILLDMDFGFFPHVTRSNTTSKNALELIQKYLDSALKRNNLTIYYISRCYQTRHGAGPMSNEKLPILLQNNKNETNKLNDYQKEFRTAVLDLDLLIYAIKCDLNFTSGIKKKIFLTCLDQIITDKIPVTYKGILRWLSPDDLQNIITEDEFRMIEISHRSFGPKANDVVTTKIPKEHSILY